jgi:hypothetical protein
MQEETEDEFLSRCAAAAQDFSDFVDEEDIDDNEYNIDLGDLYPSLSLSLSLSLSHTHTHTHTHTRNTFFISTYAYY